MPYVLKIAVGLFIMACAGAVAAWVAWIFLKKSDNPGSLIVKWAITGIGFAVLLFWITDFGLAAPGLAAGVGVLLGIIWAPSLGAMIAKPLTSFYDGGDAETEVRPFYSIAR